jgi:hypothetical protein
VVDFGESRAPIANTGGVIHDLFKKSESGVPMAYYAFLTSCGPAFGNVTTAYLAQNKGCASITIFSQSLELKLPCFFRHRALGVLGLSHLFWSVLAGNLGGYP